MHEKYVDPGKTHAFRRFVTVGLLFYNRSYWKLIIWLAMTAIATTRTLTAQVPVALAEEVDALAEQIERPKQWIIKKALIAYLAREKEKRRLIQEGLDDVDAGRVVSMEQAEEWADSLGTQNERPVPRA